MTTKVKIYFKKHLNKGSFCFLLNFCKYYKSMLLCNEEARHKMKASKEKGKERFTQLKKESFLKKKKRKRKGK